MRRDRRRARARGQRGFTLIELMVALVVSSLLIGMILSIFTRMSMAYRAQQNIAELQQTLAAAQDILQRDVRQAGAELPDGFRWAGGGATTTIQPLQIINNADGFGPDSIRLYYADASAQARVPGPLVNSADALVAFTSITVDDRDNFVPGDIAVLVTSEKDAVNKLPGPGFGDWWHHRACVVRITAINGNQLSLDTQPPWGMANNDQCDDTRALLGSPSGMLYRFAARAYRIDPARRSLAVLQMSPTGALVPDDWQDLGVGFTDLQVATRWNDYWADQAGDTSKTTDTLDVDSDPLNEWYSGEQQETLSQPIALTSAAALYHRPLPAEARVSLVVRTLKKIDAIPTSATPLLTDPARIDNNDLGDRQPVTLAGVGDASRPAELRGDAVFRHATVGADLRNLAVGQ